MQTVHRDASVGRWTPSDKLDLFEAEAVPHLQSLTVLAKYLVKNHSEAEDLVQETFAQALQSFDRYNPGTNCKAWLSKILINKRLQWLRNNSRVRQLDESVMGIPAKPGFDSNLSAGYIGETVSTALLRIPAKSRQILWLSLIEELSYKEISDRLSIPIGTVMSRLHRGRKMLSTSYRSTTSM